MIYIHNESANNFTYFFLSLGNFKFRFQKLLEKWRNVSNKVTKYKFLSGVTNVGHPETYSSRKHVHNQKNTHIILE